MINPKKTTNTQIIQAFLAFEVNALDTFKAEIEFVAYEAAARKYVASIKGFVAEAEMDFGFYDPVPSNSLRFTDFYKAFEHYVNQYRAALEARLAIMQASPNLSSSDVMLVLTADHKVQIHNRINQIRKIIEVAELPTDKKDAIYGKIAALSKEVDKEKTALGTTLVAILDISNIAGKAAKNVDPLTKKIETLYKLFSSAKEESDQLQIGVDEMKQLPAPEDD